MGNVVANVQEVFGTGNKEPPTPELKELTQRQIDIIKSTWAIPYAKPLDSGEIILYTYFERFPLNQQKFSAFRNTPLIMLKGTPGFRSHAHKIMRIFAAAIDALGTDNGTQVILGMVAEIGKYHRRRGVEKKSFNQLRFVIIDILSDVCKLDDEGKKAWNDLMDVLYHIIFTVLDETKKISGRK